MSRELPSLPRQLEAAGLGDAVRSVLSRQTRVLWSGGAVAVPLIAMTGSLARELARAGRTGRLVYGYEAIRERLSNEARGIEAVSARIGSAPGERASRLILVASDGSQRLYRRVEGLLVAHAPRVLGCLTDQDASSLGKTVSGEDRRIKMVMAEHKHAVSCLLKSLLEA